MKLKLTENKLKQIVAESVKKIMTEANIGRGTTTTQNSDSYRDEYHDNVTYYYDTSENPYSNDAVQMLADRLEKRLGKGYKVIAHNNPQNKKIRNHYDPEGTAFNKSNIVEFDISLPNSKYSNIEDILYISKIVNQMFSKMDRGKFNINQVNYDDLGQYTTSITISIELYNINEPRKNMMPKKAYKNGEKTGFANTNFTKPESWHYTEY